jgi:GT2 family glycosyltransferase
VVEPDGTIRQAGYFFSAFRRAWTARLNRVPEVLLDVSGPLLCPVGSDVQLVRRDWIERVGLYDEGLTGVHAALDYCLRVSEAGGDAVLEPTVRGRALAAADGDESDEASAGLRRLQVKHAGVSFARWSPEVV